LKKQTEVANLQEKIANQERAIAAQVEMSVTTWKNQNVICCNQFSQW